MSGPGGLSRDSPPAAAAHQFGIPLIRSLQLSTPVLEEVDAPLAANIAPDVTAGLFQYDPFETPSCLDLGVDCHVCAGIAREAETPILHFFETALDPDQPAEIIDPFLSGIAVGAEDANSELAPR